MYQESGLLYLLMRYSNVTLKQSLSIFIYFYNDIHPVHKSWEPLEVDSYSVSDTDYVDMWGRYRLNLEQVRTVVILLGVGSAKQKIFTSHLKKNVNPF